MEINCKQFLMKSNQAIIVDVCLRSVQIELVHYCLQMFVNVINLHLIDIIIWLTHSAMHQYIFCTGAMETVELEVVEPTVSTKKNLFQFSI